MFTPFAADLLADLTARRDLPAPTAAAVADAERRIPLSLASELRTLLYGGVTALAGGLGALLYEHHERLGPGLILSLMTALLLVAAWYAGRHRPRFTWGVAPRTSVGADYALLLACLLFLGIEGYAQAEYTVFGTRYGLASAVPAVLFLAAAYFFDHRGVLALGLTALAAWVGFTVAPLGVLTSFDFVPARLRAAAIGLGSVLTAVAFGSEWRGRKAHFAPTYLSLGANLAGVGLASVLIDGWDSIVTHLLCVPALAGLAWALYRFAHRIRSYWFLVLAAGWGYFLVTYLWIRLMWLGKELDEGVFLLSAIYFMLSAAGIVRFFLNLKKLLPPAPGETPSRPS